MKIMIFTKMISQNLRKDLCKNRLNIVEIFQKRTEHGSVAIQFVNLTVKDTCEKISFWFARRPAGDLKVKFNIRGINFIRLRYSFKNSIWGVRLKRRDFFSILLKLGKGDSLLNNLPEPDAQPVALSCRVNLVLKIELTKFVS